MKNIFFKKIRVQNFLSFGDTPTELVYTNGLTFVTGKNLDDNSKNGVGKTTLFIEALSFALFGETYRNIINKGISNWSNNKTCIVQLWFSVNNDEYLITRSLSPSKLILHKNDADITKSITETNKDILNILGLSKEVFVNTMVMTNKDSASFLNQGKTPKTKFIEGILSLEFFSKMFEKAKKEYNVLYDETSRLEAKCIELKSNIEVDKKYELEEVQKVKQFIFDCLNEIDGLQKLKTVDHSNTIIELKIKLSNTIDEITALDEKKLKISNALIKTTTTIDSKTAELKKFESIKFNCPTCGSPMSNDKCDKSAIEEQKNILKKEIIEQKSIKVKLETASNKNIHSLNDTIRIRKQIENEIFLLEKEQVNFDNIQNKISELRQAINTIKDRKNPFSEKIKESIDKLSTYQAKIDSSNAMLKIYEARKFVCSPAGAKTDAIKKIIEVFNNRIDYYLTRLNFPYKIVFDEFFEERLFNKKGAEISYGNLSGGETKRLDFSMLFAFRDIRRTQSNVILNVSVFDELFDSALDGNGIADIVSLLKETSILNNEAYYIITHRPEHIDTNEFNIIHLEKVNGLTIIK